VKYDKWLINNIVTTGNHSLTSKLILDNLQLKLPGKYTYSELKDAIDRLYGLGSTEKVFFSLIDDENNGKTLKLTIVEKKSSSVNVGMRLNTTDAVSVLLNYSRKDYKNYFSHFAVTTNISSNPEITACSEFSKGSLPIVGLQLTSKYRAYQVYANGSRFNTSEVFYNSGSGYLYQTLKKDASLGAGFKVEMFKGSFFSIVSDSAIALPQSKSVVTNAYIFFSKDNLDNFYFPTCGIELYSELSLVKDIKKTDICPVFLYRSRSAVELTNRVCVLFNLYGRAIITGQIPDFKQTFIGGHDYEVYFSNHLPFYGIPPVMPARNISSVAMGGVRLNLYKKHYVSVIANFLLQNNQLDEWTEAQTEWGWAIDYKYKSIVGPAGFTLGYSNWFKAPVFSANIGLWF
jgi:NTE family protein